MAANRDFVDYCLELLSGIGPCTARRMFGGWGLSLDGLNMALIADLGDGEKLWLKADANSQPRFEAEGCARFAMTMTKKGAPVQMSLGYYSAPVDAMESALAMTPWARLALESARKAHRPKPARRAPAKKAVRRPANRPPGG
ncbi:MAG: TfoX/Sxy family protein [Rhodoferax sp.]|nr:TfoX/Sxy family protein [Rhodoferax sp.]